MTIEQARERLAEYGATASRQFPADYPERNGWRPLVESLHDNVVGGVEEPMFVLLSGVALLLLVVCVNVAHLVLARSSGRAQEIAVRQALGASAGRLVRQLAAESTLLTAVGALLAVLVASWALRGLIALAPARVPRIDEIAIDVTTLLVTAAISLVVMVLFAVVPALHARRVDLVATLKEGGHGRSSERRAGRTRTVLVAAEIAMATVLLVGAGLFVRTVAALLDAPLGFGTDRLLTARITLPRPNETSRAAYLDPARRVAFYRETLRRVSLLPDVERAAMSSQIPIGGFNPPVFVEIDTRGAEVSDLRPVMHHFQVSPSYFETMGISIARGRPFSELDRAGAEEVAVVSEAAALMYWRGRDPVGQRVRFAPGLPWMTVIGVASDVLNRRLNEPPQPIIYRSLEQSSELSLALLIRYRGEAPTLGERVSREVMAVDPRLPVYSVRPMAELIDAAVAQRRFLMRLLVVFGGVATVLALVGVYGVMMYSVSQRTREIGIRMAVGARQIDVSRMVMGRGMALTAAGVAIGFAAALALSQLVRSQLFGVRPFDPMTFAVVLLLMAAVAAAAAYLPARRAARVDPIVALRAQ